MKIRVDTYDGYRSGERPLRFHIGRKRREVVDVLDRWYGEDHDYFKVRADDGGVYVLRYHRDSDRWELMQYSAVGDAFADRQAEEEIPGEILH